MWPKFPKWSCITKPQKYPKRVLPRPTLTFGEIFKVKVGPIAIGDSQGVLTSKFWICYQLDDKVLIRSAINDTVWSTPIELFTEIGQITALDFSFDQLGREVVFYKVGSELRLWFFDSSAIPSGFVKSTIVTDADYPHINFDIIDNTGSPLSDVILCYVKNDTIYNRIQRDRFATEYNTGVNHPGIKIESSGLTENNRYQIVYIYPDLRDGATLPKVYEVSQPIFNQLRFNNVEIGFTIKNAPNECELKKLAQSFNLPEQYFTILANFGEVAPAAQSPTDNEETLLLRFAVSENSEDILLQVLSNPGFVLGSGQTGAYYSEWVSDFRFTNGDYILRFTQISSDPISPTKRLELIKDGLHIIDREVFDIKSRDNDLPFPGSSINKLRFGAQAITAFPTTTTYINPYPVKFTNMYCICNGVRTDWPVTEVEGVDSIPSGNPVSIKFKNSNQPGWSFFPFTPVTLPPP